MKGNVPPVPGSVLDSPNAWNDKLRMVRYDERKDDWVISTSEGFCSLKTLESVPEKIKVQPPVNVMGLNCWEKDSEGDWLCGSFCGLFKWDRMNAKATDWYTGEPAPESAGAPFGKIAISGSCTDAEGGFHPVEYNEGTDFPTMPERFAKLPMSLWNLSLEVHTGRIYTFLGPVNLIFIFFAGLAAIWCLWTGYKVRLKKKRKKKVL